MPADEAISAGEVAVAVLKEVVAVAAAEEEVVVVAAVVGIGRRWFP